MSETEAQHFIFHEHVYLRQFIQAADQKAGFTLAASSASLGFLVNNFASDKSLISGSTCRLILGVLIIILLGLSGLLAAISVRPRQNGIVGGLVGWIGILEHKNGSDYLAAIQGANPTSQLADHCWSLASILRRKYSLLKLAIYSFIGGGVTTALVLIVFALRHGW